VLQDVWLPVMIGGLPSNVIFFCNLYVIMTRNRFTILEKKYSVYIISYMFLSYKVSPQNDRYTCKMKEKNLRSSENKEKKDDFVCVW
jgi:hypothetical protein